MAKHHRKKPKSRAVAKSSNGVMAFLIGLIFHSGIRYQTREVILKIQQVEGSLRRSLVSTLPNTKLSFLG